MASPGRPLAPETGERSGVRRVAISPEVSVALVDALEPVPPLAEDPESFLEAVGPLVAEALPPEVRSTIVDLSRLDSRHGVLVLDGVARHATALPPTPRDVGEIQPWTTVAADGIVLGIALLLGQPVGYAAEKRGALVQNVFPVRDEEHSPSNEGSLLSLDLHTELTFSRLRPDAALDGDSPDFLLLSCLRADPAAAATTLLVDGQQLCQRLPSRVLDVVRQPRFELRAPYSFTRDGDGSRPWVGPTALIKGPPMRPRLGFDLACGTRASDPEAERALHVLRAVAADPEIRSEVRLNAGDMLVIDNRRCLHGRSSFAPRYDGRDRWLQRVYVRRSLPAAGERALRIL